MIGTGKKANMRQAIASQLARIDSIRYYYYKVLCLNMRAAHDIVNIDQQIYPPQSTKQTSDAYKQENK